MGHWYDRTKERAAGDDADPADFVTEERVVLGAAKALRTRPYHPPEKVEGSSQPRFLAATKVAFKSLREAYQEMIAAFREASERLLAGDRDAEFPEGAVPPGLPFVPFVPSPAPIIARGQPA